MLRPLATAFLLVLGVLPVVPGLAAQEKGAMELRRAVEEGDAARVDALLQRNVSADVPDAGGQTPLFLAARDGHTEIARLLLEAGADPNHGDHYGTTPLMYAAGRGHLDVTVLLVEYGAELDVQGGRAFHSALMSAAEAGHGDVVGFLLDAGANASLAGMDERDAYALAMENGHSSLADEIQLAQRGESFTPVAFFRAVEEGDVEFVRHMVREGFDVNTRLQPDNEFAAPHTALTVAVDVGDPEMVRELLDLGADPTVTLYYGEFDVLSPLGRAVERGQTEIARILLEAGASADVELNAFGWTALMDAASDGRVPLTELLLDYGADTEARSNTPGAPGWTAIMWAAQEGYLATARLLADAGAVVEVSSDDGQTPIRLAEDGGFAALADFLRRAAKRE
ncbi:MAG: ankyrin repeat domain-containing protein [Gemmatimonadales bacterium]